MKFIIREREWMDTLNICSTGDRVRVRTHTYTQTYKHTFKHHFQLRLFIYLFRASEHFDRETESIACDSMIWYDMVMLCWIYITYICDPRPQCVYMQVCVRACLSQWFKTWCAKRRKKIYKYVLKILLGRKMKLYGRLVAFLAWTTVHMSSKCIYISYKWAIAIPHIQQQQQQVAIVLPSSGRINKKKSHTASEHIRSRWKRTREEYISIRGARIQYRRKCEDDIRSSTLCKR